MVELLFSSSISRFTLVENKYVDMSKLGKFYQGPLLLPQMPQHYIKLHYTTMNQSTSLAPPHHSLHHRRVNQTGAGAENPISTAPQLRHNHGWVSVTLIIPEKLCVFLQLRYFTVSVQVQLVGCINQFSMLFEEVRLLSKQLLYTVIQQYTSICCTVSCVIWGVSGAGARTNRTGPRGLPPMPPLLLLQIGYFGI